MGGYEEMMTSADKVGGWVKKGQNHDDVIHEWSLTLRTKKLVQQFAFSLISKILLLTVIEVL